MYPNRHIVVTFITTLICLIGVDLVVRRAMPVIKAYDVADYDRKPNVLRATSIPEIVLMGSSRAKYALVPDDFEALTGRSTFNMGIAGSKVVEWLVLVRQLFSVHKPRLVVLGINASEVRADYQPLPAARYLFSFDDLLESLARDGVSIETLGAYLDGRMGPVWTTYHRRYELKMWCQEQLGTWLPKYAQASRELRRRVATPCPPKGYAHPWMFGRRLRDLAQRLLQRRANVAAASVPHYSRNAPTFRCLAQLLEWFHHHDIPVVVAYIPNSPETEKHWVGVEPKMIDAIDEVCQQNGVRFVRCDPADLPRTNHDFMEEIHVGLPLAHRISRRVARYVKMAYFGTTPSHRLATSSNPRQSEP